MIIAGAAWLACVAAVITPSTGVRVADDVSALASSSSGQQKHLAVIVPAYRGDLQRAVSSLKRWPTVCSSLTQANVDLVLYYAEGDEDAQEVDEAVEKISESAGRCFATTRTVYASLEGQDDFYPKGPSVQFYKMFLDDDVRAQLAEFDALAIMEWDMLVAADNSFEELYKAAFVDGGEFWVKGSNLGGTNFHTTAKDQEMWHVLGHINGNAIYNNNDPAFVEYVEYTRARWQYDYPYDVALWLTISDFPYSWPLWQRYSSKFVTTNLISSVGGEHVDSSSVSDAIAGHTLFIHGNRVDDGNIASRKAEETNKRRSYFTTERKRKGDRKRRQRLRAPLSDEAIEPACTSACGSEEAASSLPDGTSTVCDASCGSGSPLIDDFLCDAGDAERYGSKCRICFNDEEEAHRLRHVLLDNFNQSMQPKVIMCDTMKPPEPDCTSECLSNNYTVCDDSCGTGRYGDFDCNWKDGGHKCRFCFNDVEAALAADNVAKLQGGRVIMCATMEPPLETDGIDVDVQDILTGIPDLLGGDLHKNKFLTLATSEGDKAGGVLSNKNILRRLQEWRETEKWKTDEKWRENEKYKVMENWKFEGLQFPEAPGQEVCLDECPRLYSNGITGRICDDTCATREYGFAGCQTKDGIFGTNCRQCYVDPELAFDEDDIENNERAIMCDTGLPVTAYDQNPTRRLTAEHPESALSIGHRLQNNKIRPHEVSTSIMANDPENGSYGNPELLGNDMNINRRLVLDASEAVKAGNESPSNPNTSRRLQEWRETEKWKTDEKWRENEKYKVMENWKFEGLQFPEAPGQEVCLDECPRLYSNGITGRICDDTCATREYGFVGCQTKDGIFGTNCRQCYVDPELAFDEDDIENNERAIMCDTGLPVTAYDQNPTRRLTAEDPKSALSIGQKLQNTRRRPHEASTSVVVNKPENGSYGNTELPRNDLRSNQRLALDVPEADKAGEDVLSKPNTSRNLQEWRETEKWKTEEKWRSNEKYKLMENWKFEGLQFPEAPGQEVCLDECPRLYSNEMTGRICDDTCATREYGFVGCQTKDGIFGTNCRQCYVDPELAFEEDDIENNERAIMCDTGLPVTAYDQNPTRRLTPEDPKSTLSIAQSLQDTRRQTDEASTSVGVNDSENGSYGSAKMATTELDNLFAELSRQPFTEDITRGEICAFIAGREEEVDKWEVTVRSILQFEPGMRVAIAVEGDPQVYRRAVGNFPGVIVRRTPNAFLASLNADKHCGPGTRLIYYVEADSVLSRTFTAKDTHSPDGELLVVYSEPRTHDAVELSILSSSVLGFRPPSFTYGADLILPVEANAALRDWVLSKFGNEGTVPGDAAELLGSMGEFSETAAVPQVLAALEYSRKAPGVWFFNPQTWVAEHLFKPASIWEIPLVKPRFACTLPANAQLPNPAEVLEENLDFFSHGGKCESGLIAVDASR